MYTFLQIHNSKKEQVFACRFLKSNKACIGGRRVWSCSVSTRHLISANCSHASSLTRCLSYTVITNATFYDTILIDEYIRKWGY